MTFRLRSGARWALGLALGACTGAEPPPTIEPLPSFEVSPGEAALRRLTAAQYRTAIADLFGPGLAVPALEPDFAVGGFFAVGASETSVSPLGVERYEQAALSIAEQALVEPARARWIDCAPSDACTRQVLSRLGRRAFRRSLDPEEVERFAAIAQEAAATLGSADAGLRFGAAAILQSPSFLYRVELGRPDPSGVFAHDNWEMATRLAYLVWNAGPDDALLEAAEKGELTTDAGLTAQFDRLWSSPRARDGVRAFFSDRFRLHELDRLTKDPTVYAHASPELGPAAKEETLRVLEALIFAEDGDYRTLMTRTQTFVDRRLAALYQVQAPAFADFGPVEFSRSSGRRGLLGHASFLALAAHATSSSATLRGKFVLETLLCRTVAPPPADANTAIPEVSPDARTLRDRLVVHRTNPTCAACHTSMDGIGLSFEQFDGVGRFRETDNGAPIDPSGSLDDATFRDAWEAGAALEQHPNLGPCMVQALYGYATGRIPGAGEAPQLADLSERFRRSGHRVRALFLDIVLSPGFRRATEATR